MNKMSKRNTNAAPGSLESLFLRIRNSVHEDPLAHGFMRTVHSAVIRGQESFLLRSNQIELAITKLGAMLAPVTFFPNSTTPIQPYHVAPWAEEPLSRDTPAMLRALRGDWFCCAFGQNQEPHAGQYLPPHGETANCEWYSIARHETRSGSWLQLGIDLPLQGGRCESTTALLADQSIIYQCHEFTGLTGLINPGHHVTLQFPSTEGAGRLSFSRFTHARTFFDAIDGPGSRHYSRLQPSYEIRDLTVVPCGDGVTTDLTRYPARHGFDDIVILCADPTVQFAWSAVTFPEQGYVWFALRDPKQLASTLLWFSNGGRQSAPWNGRHINVLGMEDITAFFHLGAAASCRSNALSARGMQTCLKPDAQGRLCIPYIQGVAHIPRGFDQVATIDATSDGHFICLTSASGIVVHVSCCIDFLRTKQIACQ